MSQTPWKDSNVKPVQSPFIPLHSSEDLTSDRPHALCMPLYPLNPLIRITTLASNSSSCLVVSEEGLVFGCNFSRENQLCPYTENSFALIQIPNLINIVQVSLSASHAAAISGSGKLFTWGEGSSGQVGYFTTSFCSFPILVRSCQYLKVTQVLCGQNYTSILTDRSYVHIYGKTELAHESIHMALWNKSQLAFSHIQTGSNPILCLSGTGNVLTLDRSLNLIGIPAKSYWNFASIIACELTLFKSLKGGMVMWEAQGIENQILFELYFRTGKMWRCESYFKVFSWGKSLVLCLKAEDKLGLSCIIEPCKISEMGNVLMKRMRRKYTFKFFKNETSPAIMERNSGELLDEESYFNEKFAETLKNSLYDKIISILHQGLPAIKEISLFRNLKIASLRELNLFNLMIKNYEKSLNHMKFVSFYKIKLLTLSYFPLKSSDCIKYTECTKNTISSLEFLKAKYIEPDSFDLFAEKALNKLSNHTLITNNQFDSQVFSLKNLKSSEENLIELRLDHFFSILTAIIRKTLSKTFRLLKNLLSIKANLYLFELLMKKVIIRKLRTYSNSLLWQTRFSFRSIKNLVKKRVKNYLNQIILYSANESNCYLLKVLYSTQSIFANHGFRHKLFAFRALKMAATQPINTPQKSALALSRSLSIRTLDSITETPRKQKKNSPEPLARIAKPFKSESLSIVFKSPPRNCKTTSDYLLSHSPSIAKARSPKPTRPPWRPPSHFASPPVSPSRLMAHTRRKQYTDLIKFKSSPRTLKSKTTKLISSSKVSNSQSSSPVHEKMISINLGLMNINRVIRRYLIKSNSLIFRKLKLYADKRYIPAPKPNDDKTILNVIRNSWKAGVIILASEKTRDILTKILSREFISALKNI